MSEHSSTLKPVLVAVEMERGIRSGTGTTSHILNARGGWSLQWDGDYVLATHKDNGLTRHRIHASRLFAIEEEIPKMAAPEAPAPDADRDEATDKSDKVKAQTKRRRRSRASAG